MATKTIHIDHLGGTDVGYAMAAPYEASKPTCVMVNSMCTTSALYREQFASKRLADAFNLLAIEPLGHGATISKSEHFTYWDSAAMALRVMDALGIKKAFALGTSQGGWIVMRMALLAPERIEGVIPLGTSMDYESEYSRSKGCWDPSPILKPFMDKWTSMTSTPEWTVDDEWCRMVGSIGFGASATEATTAFWMKTLKGVYKGDEGRKKARMAVICLLERDGLLLRLQDIKCPVAWLQGDQDMPFGLTLPQEHIKMFTNSVDARFIVVKNGAHYLNASSPQEVEETLLNLVAKYHRA